MTSGSKQPTIAATESSLTTVLTLEGHTGSISSISYFPDSKHIASGSYDKTARRWDLHHAGKEIEEAQDVWEQEVDAVAVSRDDRWIITAGGDANDCGELKARNIKTGIVKTFQGHSDRINCIDISADSILLASGAEDRTTRIWNLNTGELVDGPFKSADKVGAIRFSLDSKKLAIKSCAARCLEVWDVQAQKLDVRIGKYDRSRPPDTPVFWTMKGKSIVAAFSFTNDKAVSIYEFDVSTLRTIGAPFEGHTDTISGLALSFDCVLLASASGDQTIKLWAFESRQLLASFSVQRPRYLILSPNSCQLAYTTYDDTKIHICDTPLDILASMWPAQPRISAHQSNFPPGAMFQDLGDRVKAVKTKKIKKIRRELRICANLNHANIISVYGSAYGFSPFKAILSPWVQNCDLTSYLEFEGAALTLVRRLRILQDIAAGLQYLHAFKVIHGDLTVYNVLIDGDGTSCIAEFGLSSMYSEVISASQASWTSTLVGNVRWMAPELLVPERENGFPTRPSEQSGIKFHSLSSASQNPCLAVLHDLTRYITKDEEYPAASGGFGEIWKCTYKTDEISIKVAVKSLRVYAADQGKEKKNERIQRELGICASLKHVNVLPVYGYTSGFSPFIAIVSRWAENGDLTAYLEREGKTLTVVRRFQILRDVIAGLQYLHINRVIHGDFNGFNILIHGDGTACIADFGLSLKYSEVIGASKASWTSTPIQGNLPWMAPELLQERNDGCQVRPSEQSDIYSFGGIMLQVLTNKIPYYYLTHRPAIIICIANWEKPDRTFYPVILDRYWQLIERCWSTLPQDCPSAEEVEGDITNEFNSLSGSH